MSFQLVTHLVTLDDLERLKNRRVISPNSVAFWAHRRSQDFVWGCTFLPRKTF